jgi:hypothetical protein
MHSEPGRGDVSGGNLNLALSTDDQPLTFIGTVGRPCIFRAPLARSMSGKTLQARLANSVSRLTMMKLVSNSKRSEYEKTEMPRNTKMKF